MHCRVRPERATSRSGPRHRSRSWPSATSIGALVDMGLEGRNSRVIVHLRWGAASAPVWTPTATSTSRSLLAHRTGRPVKILYNREEEFAYLSPRQSSARAYRSGLRRRRQAHLPEDSRGPGQRCLHFLGSYLPDGDAAARRLPSTASEHLEVLTAKVVYTNNTYCQAMRGYGNPEAHLGDSSATWTNWRTAGRHRSATRCVSDQLQPSPTR